MNADHSDHPLAAKVLTEALRKAGRNPTRESLYAALSSLGRLDVGGYVVQFGPDRRHGNHYVELAVIAGCLVAWSGFTAATAFVGSYAQLFAVRMGVGVGEAGATSPSVSPKQESSSASASSTTWSWPAALLSR